MMENAPKTLSKPADAGRFKCSLSFESNGSGAKTCKVKAIAITSDVFQHSGWIDADNPQGRLLFDLSGFRTRKMPVAMKYNHGSTVIGEWNRFELSDGNLVAHGIIKSVRDDDLASDLIKKLDAKIPHEASIGWDDEVEIEFVDEGEICAANGKLFVGPLYCVRAFFVRELSIVDLGACPGTETVADNGDEQTDIPQEQPAETAVYTFSAKIRERHYVKLAKDLDTSPRVEIDATNQVCGESENILESGKYPTGGTSTTGGSGTGSGAGSGQGGTNETPVQILSNEPKPEVETAEAQAIEAGDTVEGEAEQNSIESKLSKYGKEWGYENAVRWLCEDKLSIDQAKEHFYQILRAENEQLKQFAAKQQGTSVDFIPSDDPAAAINARAAKLQKQGISKGQSQFISEYLK